MVSFQNWSQLKSSVHKKVLPSNKKRFYTEISGGIRDVLNVINWSIGVGFF